jgi:hypothetical protein
MEMKKRVYGGVLTLFELKLQILLVSSAFVKDSPHHNQQYQCYRKNTANYCNDDNLAAIRFSCTARANFAGLNVLLRTKTQLLSHSSKSKTSKNLITVAKIEPAKVLT